MDRTKAVFVIGIVLAGLAVFIVPAAASNYFYLVPQNSSCGPGGSVLVSVVLHVDTTPTDNQIGSAQVHIDFNSSVVNITGVVEPVDKNDWDIWGYKHMGNYVFFNGNEFGGFGPGEIYLGNMTLNGTSPGVSPIEFTHFYPQKPDPTNIGDKNGNNVSFFAINGTFTCNELEQCLGTCCNDSNCTDPFAINVTCKYCDDLVGKYWKPNKDSACFANYSPSDLCLNYCPQCCNGTDDDSDTYIDYPSDSECTCGLDPSEVEKLPPIPELPTMLLYAMGVLVLTGYVWQRRSKRTL